MSPVKPVPPKGTPTQVVIRDGDSLGALAVKYNTSVNSIMAANGLKDPNKIKPGQVLTINVVSAAELKRYNDLLAVYENQVREAEHKKEVQQRTAKAEAKIEKAKNDGYARDYSFSINSEGHIVIKLKDSKQLEDIRDDFGLPKGRLRETNPSIEQRYKIGKGVRSSDGEYYDTWDSVEAKKGDTFVIDTNDFKTSKTLRQTLSDVYHAIKFW